jgi:plastocyanin
MKRLVPALGLIALALILVACSGAAGGPSGPAPSLSADALQISAKDLKFSTTTLTAKADTAFQIAFDNQEAAPHNVAIYKDESAAEKIFAEDPFGGPKQVVYNVPATPAGSYFFRCDLHPDMKGAYVVE